MPDYKELYLKLFRANEQAINTLIQAQQECEDLYLCTPEPRIKVISFPPEHPENAESPKKEWL